MTNPHFIEELSEKVSRILAASPMQDVEKNLRATVSAFLARLDLVTREEFDVQQEVLLRTREQLAALEARVAALEAAGTAAGKN